MTTRAYLHFKTKLLSYLPLTPLMGSVPTAKQRRFLQNIYGLFDVDGDVKQFVLREAGTNFEPGFDDPEPGMLRFRRCPKLDIFSMGSKRYDRGLSLAYLAYGQVGREVYQVLDNIGVTRAKSDDEIRKKLTALSTYAKKQGDSFSPNWRYYVNLELLGGFLKDKPVETFLDDVKFWVTGNSPIQIDGSHEKFLNKFEQSLDYISNTVSGQPVSEWVTVDEYLSNPAYWQAEGGFFSRRNVYARLHLGEEKMRKTKKNASLVLEKNELLHMMYDNSLQAAKTLQKREAGKIRAVINADFELYLQMTYLSMYLEPLFANHPVISTYNNKRMEADMYKYIVESCHRQTVKFPLDQSKFDHKPSIEMNLAIIRMLKKLLLKFYPPHLEVHKIIDVVLDSMRGGTVHVGKYTVPYEKGLLSGWRWTTFLVSLTNYAEMLVIKNIYEEIYGYDPVADMRCQGDDVRLELRDYVSCVGISRIAAEIGLEINPLKTFVSTVRDEFLRKVYTVSGVSAYPARSLTSVLWRNPLNVEVAETPLRLTSLITNWHNSVSRGCSLDRCYPLILEDLSGGTGLSKSEIDLWINTPTACGGGGFGLLPYVWEFRNTTKTKSARANYSSNVRKILGSYEDEFTRSILTQTENDGFIRKPYLGKTFLLADPKAVYGPNTAPVYDKPSLLNSIWKPGADGRAQLGQINNMTPNSRNTEDRLWQRSSRKLYGSWLRGRLPLTPCRDWRFGTAATAMYCEELIKNVFGALLMRWRPTYGTALASGRGLHVLTRSLLDDVVVVSG